MSVLCLVVLLLLWISDSLCMVCEDARGASYLGLLLVPQEGLW